MDLKEYLTSSKLQRNLLVKQASKYLQTMTNGDIGSDLNEDKSSEFLLGPNPLRLKTFENQINLQLQNFYRYGDSTPDNSKSSFIKNISINERIKRIYSRNIQKTKKKQNIMIPKTRNLSNIRILVPLNRQMNNSPYLRTNKKNTRPLDIEKANTSLPSINPILLKDLADQKNYSNQLM